MAWWPFGESERGNTVSLWYLMVVLMRAYDSYQKAIRIIMMS